MRAWDLAMAEARAVLQSDTGVPMPIRMCVEWNKVPLNFGKPLCFEILEPHQPLVPDDPALDIVPVLIAIAEEFEPWNLPPDRREHMLWGPNKPKPHWHLSVCGNYSRGTYV